MRAAFVSAGSFIGLLTHLLPMLPLGAGSGRRSCFTEHKGPAETAYWVTKAGRKAVTASGDVAEDACCKSLAQRAVNRVGRLDILVNNNSAMQCTHKDIGGNHCGGMGSDIPHKYVFAVLLVQSRHPAHQAGRGDREYDLHQREESAPGASVSAEFA